MQSRHTVELAEVQAGLLCQVGTHVLIADGRHAGDVRVIPGGEVGTYLYSIRNLTHWAGLNWWLNILKANSGSW